MTPLEKTLATIKNPIVLIALAILAVLIVLFALNNPQVSPGSGSSKAVIEKKLNRSDFTVEKVLTNKDGWMLVEIRSTASESQGNTAYAILHEEGDSMTLKLGPGTYFDKFSMSSADVPSSVQEEIQSFFNKKRK